MKMMRTITGARNQEQGFTVIELAMTIVILVIIMSTITVSWHYTRRRMALKSGGEEIEAAIRRSYDICMQEGVDVYLQFWDSGGAHPDQYTIYRSYPSGFNEQDDDQPTEPPIPGGAHTTDGEGHYWFKLAEGKVQVENSITLYFQRRGTVINVSGPGSGTQWTIGIFLGGDQGRIAVNDIGEVVEPE
ncbi:MAG: prepilin-type N-terminal cleavage/methylation domain-containing protein [Actinomycetota bacterium]|nr:prepilin-type N-terminal cleavage/methylation domain-containing protein [Actinomycetota bacterium]